MVNALAMIKTGIVKWGDYYGLSGTMLNAVPSVLTTGKITGMLKVGLAMEVEIGEMNPTGSRKMGMERSRCSLSLWTECSLPALFTFVK